MSWLHVFVGAWDCNAQLLNFQQWDPVDAKWVAVRPPPASDPRLHELGNFLDPNFDLNLQHLDKDFSISASVALEVRCFCSCRSSLYLPTIS